jgi:hypothetical protein
MRGCVEYYLYRHDSHANSGVREKILEVKLEWRVRGLAQVVGL